MSFDFTFALYVFCMDYHSGQSSRLYRILSRIVSRGIQIQDSAIKAIQGNRHNRHEVSTSTWDEWEQARIYYRELKRKYGQDRR